MVCLTCGKKTNGLKTDAGTIRPFCSDACRERRIQQNQGTPTNKRTARSVDQVKPRKPRTKRRK